MLSDWPIIVGGCLRSGTSLVRRILDTHSRIHCGPEVKFFRDFYGDYFHDPLRHLRFSVSARSIVSDGELLRILGRAFVEIHQKAAAQQGKARWADKNPENVLHLDDWNTILGDEWLFVHVVREPLDTIASMKEAQFPLTLPQEVPGLISFYRRYIEAGLSFGSVARTRYFRLTYEDLVQNPARAVKALMAFVREDFEPIQLRFNDVQHQSGLEDPKVDSTGLVHDQSIGRWSRILSEAESDLVSRETADLRPLFGLA